MSNKDDDASTPQCSSSRQQLESEENAQPRVVLNALHVLGILFMACIGGAYGLENAVKSGGGPLLPLIFILVLPWVWGLPIAVAVAELACAMPSNAGAVVWVNVTFPPWVSCTTALWTVTYNLVDNALYPNMFADYLLQLVHLEDILTSGWRWVVSLVIKVGVVSVSAMLNIRGVDIVGSVAVVLCVVVVSPFLAMSLLAIPKYRPRNWITPPKAVNWGLFVSTITWNISGFDSAGHIVEEVQSPAKTYAKALVGLLVVTSVVYGIPVLAGTSVLTDWDQWHDGYWVDVAQAVGGLPLKWWMSIGAAISSLGFMISLLCTTSRALQGIASMNVFPTHMSSYLARISGTYGTPVNAIIWNSVFTILFSLLMDFEFLLQLDAVMYALRIMLEMAALVILRWKYPHLPRPYRLPGGIKGCICILIFPMIWCCITVAFALSHNWHLCIGIMVALPLTIVSSYFYVRCFRYYGFEGSIGATTFQAPSKHKSSASSESSRMWEVEMNAVF